MAAQALSKPHARAHRKWGLAPGEAWPAQAVRGSAGVRWWALVLLCLALHALLALLLRPAVPLGSPRGASRALALGAAERLFLQLRRGPLPASSRARKVLEAGAQKGGSAPSGDEKRLAEELSRAWGRAYGLEGNSTAAAEVAAGVHMDSRTQAWVRADGSPGYIDTALPPPKVHLRWNASVPLPAAPHLEECTDAERRRRQIEQDRQGGKYPPWTCPQEGKGKPFCSQPQPPWIRGTDADNLPFTRVAQRDIWVNQFPPNCSDPSVRFLVVSWSDDSNGIGSQLHVMSVALSQAMQAKRVLIVPGYSRANHDGCRRFGRGHSFECYFAPLSSCTDEVQTQSLPTRYVPGEINSRKRVVHLLAGVVQKAFESGAAEAWVSKWWQESPFELLGYQLTNFETAWQRVSWWRSQAIRFMLRWPSAYLCHLTNKARHTIYGAEVAREVAAAMLAQAAAGGPEPGEGRSGAQGHPLLQAPPWSFSHEPYIPRPIISLHLRQGDKGREMNLFSLQTCMWLAYRIRRLVPAISHVWLSTEMQSVINESAKYGDWKFYFTNVRRQQGETAMVTYESENGYETHVGSSYVNLILATQCDYFVGVLGSNWNRLINELRATGGRLKANYMAANYDDW